MFQCLNKQICYTKSANIIFIYIIYIVLSDQKYKIACFRYIPKNGTNVYNNLNSILSDVYSIGFNVNR